MKKNELASCCGCGEDGRIIYLIKQGSQREKARCLSATKADEDHKPHGLCEECTADAIDLLDGEIQKGQSYLN